MKKQTINLIKIITLGLILSGSLTLAYTAPTSLSTNTKPPIDTTNVLQNKAGGLGIGGLLAVFGKTAVHDDVNIINNKNLYVSGGFGIGDLMANMAPEEVLQVRQANVSPFTNYLGTMKVSALQHTLALPSPYQSYNSNLRPVCVDAQGKLLLCLVSAPTPQPACHGSQTFDSSGSFTVPACASSVTLKAWAGGGGGGGGSATKGTGNDGDGGGGGGSGGIATTTYSGTFPATFSFSIGGGGGGGAGGNKDADGWQTGYYGYTGSSGGATTISGAASLTAGGGSGGRCPYISGCPNGGSGGSGGPAGSGGSTGASGGHNFGGTGGGNGGAGGSDPGHNSAGNAGGNGGVPGGGGGGGSGGNTYGCTIGCPHSGGPGGSGASGRVMFTW